MYKTLVAVMKDVVEDLEGSFAPHSLAEKWQTQLETKLHEYVSDPEPIQQVQHSVPQVRGPPPPPIIGAPPPPPPPPMVPIPPKPKLLRFPGAEGLKKKHFNGYR